MAIAFESETNIGHKRQINEDSLWPKSNRHDHQADEPYGMLFIVADGMGGHGAGDVASELAVKEISTIYYSLEDRYSDIGDRLKLAIEQAHQKICARASGSPELENMGTTVATAVVKYDEVYEQGELWVAWAGDSRVYLLRDGRLKLLTRDHSRVWPLIESGQLNWDDLRFHPERSRVTNALTARRSTVAPEVERFELEPGDQLLLCSDGLAGEVRPEDIKHILMTQPPWQALQLLVEKANAPKDVYKDGRIISLEGGNDNISSILITIPDDEPPPVIPVPGAVSAPVSANPPRLGWIVGGILVTLVLIGTGLFLTLFSGNHPETNAAVPLTPLLEAGTSPPAANVVVIEQIVTDTPQPAAAAQETEPPLDETRMPTVTRVNTPTPLPPTPTPIPPTVTPSGTVTETILAEVDSTNFLTPTLIGPEAYDPEQPNYVVGQDITFSWQWPGELPEAYGFEIRAWLEGNEPSGIYDAKELKSLLQYQEEDQIYSVTLKLGGAGITTTSANYLWSVGIVQLEPYQWLDIESEQRRISIVMP